MGILQISFIVIYAINLLAAAYGHGKPKKGNYNFIERFIDVAILVGLLIWGGFFNEMGIPQILFIVLCAIVLLLAAHLHGEPKKGNYNFFKSFIAEAIPAGLLIWGGFFNDLGRTSVSHWFLGVCVGVTIILLCVTIVLLVDTIIKARERKNQMEEPFEGRKGFKTEMFESLKAVLEARNKSFEAREASEELDALEKQFDTTKKQCDDLEKNYNELADNLKKETALRNEVLEDLKKQVALSNEVLEKLNKKTALNNEVLESLRVMVMFEAEKGKKSCS